MQNDKELEQLFKSNKSEIRDRGFSKDVMNNLPEKVRILPQIIIVCFAIAGIGITIAIQGYSSFVEGLNSMITAGNQAEVLSVSALMPYLTVMLVLGSVGYAVYQSDEL